MKKDIDKELLDLKQRHNTDGFSDEELREILKNRIPQGKPVPSGTIYVSSEPEFVGVFPIRSEIKIEPSPPSMKIGWTCKEYSGAEVFKIDGTGSVVPTLLTNKNDLFPGVRIQASTLIGELIATIELDSDGQPVALSESGGTLILLEFDQDDRHCWTSAMAINTKLLRKNK